MTPQTASNLPPAPLCTSLPTHVFPGSAGEKFGTCICTLTSQGFSVQGSSFKAKCSMRIYRAINSWQDSKLLSTNASLTPQFTELHVSLFRADYMAIHFFSGNVAFIHVGGCSYIPVSYLYIQFTRKNASRNFRNILLPTTAIFQNDLFVEWFITFLFAILLDVLHYALSKSTSSIIGNLPACMTKSFWFLFIICIAAVLAGFIYRCIYLYWLSGYI